MLKQPQYAPLDEVLQIFSIFAATEGIFDTIPVDKVPKAEDGMHDFIRLQKKPLHDKVLNAAKTGAKLDEALLAEMRAAVEEFKKTLV